MEVGKKGSVCVTGGTGYVASWLIKRLLQHGYSVHATIRSHPPDKTKDISYLTTLPGAPESLKIFPADLDDPDSFTAAIEGCTGVFHVAHPMDFEDKETEETKAKRAVSGALGILQACLNSKTVKRVVYTGSISSVLSNRNGSDFADENTWGDLDFVRGMKIPGGSYMITKTMTEKAVLEFGEERGLEIVSIVPTFITGPFLTPHCPGSVLTSMALIFGDTEQYQRLIDIEMVHVDDVASAHIFLFEHPNAKGRYICSGLKLTTFELAEFLSARYPAFQIPNTDSLKGLKGLKFPKLSSKKLLDTGFKYKYGLEEIFDGAIQCCKEKGLL